VSNTVPVRYLNRGSGQLQRWKRTWHGRRRDTGGTHVGHGSSGDIARALRIRATVSGAGQPQGHSTIEASN
jgi:hypothetical protein